MLEIRTRQEKIIGTKNLEFATFSTIAGALQEEPVHATNQDCSTKELCLLKLFSKNFNYMECAMQSSYQKIDTSSVLDIK